MKSFFRRSLAVLLCVLTLNPLIPPAAAQERSADIPIIESVFPDAVFRQWLTDPANLNGAGADNVLTQEELGGILEINVSSHGISSLEGIEVFFALEELSCKNNALTELDVRQNHALRFLQCDQNRIGRLDVSGLEQLRVLYCEHNHMTDLTLTGCTALEEIYCRSNDLASVNFSTNRNLKFIEIFDNQLTEIDLSMLSRLEFVHLDHNRLTHLDLSHNPNLSGHGSGFVARNNILETLVLPNRPGQMTDWDVYREQDPQPGYERVKWYYDPLYTLQAEEFTQADGRTLYARWLPNDYTIFFDAAGGYGSMASQAAVWDTALTLPLQTLRRTGYTFACWENTYGDGARYPDGAEVKNLAGKKRQGDRVTLYAQWTPITYTISFDPGSGSGRMGSVIHTYDREQALPRCTLTHPDGLEFVGWARSPGGPVVFRDEMQVRNLTSVQDDDITLYAVWGTPALQQYLKELDAILDRYDASGYTAQDWHAIQDIYTQAMQDLTAAGNPGVMADICVRAGADMAGVPDVPARAQSVLARWRQAHQQILALAGCGAVTEANAAGLLADARSAGEALNADYVAACTDLDLPADQVLVAERARAAAQSQLAGLDRLADAAAWAAALKGLSLRPMREVTSQAAGDYQAAAAEAEGFADQLHPDLLSGLQDRAALALRKQHALQDLHTAYQGYDLTHYSEAGQAQLASIRQQAARSMESAASEADVTALLNTALAELRAVPVKTPDAQPGGGGGSQGSGSPEQEPAAPPDDAGQPPVWENPYPDVPQDAWYYDSLAYVSANGIMNGYADGTFAPSRQLSRAQLAQLLYNLAGRPDAAGAHYTDAPDGAWYASAISWATEAGILTGYADGSIRPDAPVSRQQLAAMLWRYARHAGRDVTLRADLSGYRDAGQIAPYAEEALQWANAAGILNGSGDALLPGSPATRAQTAAILTRFCTGNPEADR